MTEVVGSKILLKDVYPANDRPLVRLIGKRTPGDRLDAGASLVIVLCLSLGLWAAIWEAIVSVSTPL